MTSQTWIHNLESISVKHKALGTYVLFSIYRQMTIAVTEWAHCQRQVAFSTLSPVISVIHYFHITIPEMV